MKKPIKYYILLDNREFYKLKELLSLVYYV